MAEKTSYSDREVQEILGIKPSTMRKYMSDKGAPRSKFGRSVVDLRMVPHNCIGGKRRWNKEAIDKVAAGIPQGAI